MRKILIALLATLPIAAAAQAPAPAKPRTDYENYMMMRAAAGKLAEMKKDADAGRAAEQALAFIGRDPELLVLAARGRQAGGDKEGALALARGGLAMFPGHGDLNLLALQLGGATGETYQGEWAFRIGLLTDVYGMRSGQVKQKAPEAYGAMKPDAARGRTGPWDIGNAVGRGFSYEGIQLMDTDKGGMRDKPRSAHANAAVYRLPSRDGMRMGFRVRQYGREGGNFRSEMEGVVDGNGRLLQLAAVGMSFPAGGGNADVASLLVSWAPGGYSADLITFAADGRMKVDSANLESADPLGWRFAGAGFARMLDAGPFAWGGVPDTGGAALRILWDGPGTKLALSKDGGVAPAPAPEAMRAVKGASGLKGFEGAWLAAGNEPLADFVALAGGIGWKRVAAQAHRDPGDGNFGGRVGDTTEDMR